MFLADFIAPGATVQVGRDRQAQVPPARSPVSSTVIRRSDGMVFILIWDDVQTLHNYGARMTEQEIVAKERELLAEYADDY